MPGGISKYVVVVLLFCSINLAAADDSYKTLDWADLVPSGTSVDDIMEIFDRESRSDNFTYERRKELMLAMEEAGNRSPIRADLNDTKVRIPGYVVPLETDGKSSSLFLLVPYFGACIHVPPPPANQTILVDTGAKAAAIRKLYDVVWVSGVLKTQAFSSDLGEAGYTLNASLVEPYEER